MYHDYSMCTIWDLGWIFGIPIESQNNERKRQYYSDGCCSCDSKQRNYVYNDKKAYNNADKLILRKKKFIIFMT